MRKNSAQPRANENADIIGLSGLITPSLDEMAHVAREMEREGDETAVAHRRRHDEQGAHGSENRAALHEPVVHVLDARRAVPVVSNLISAEQKAAIHPTDPRRIRSPPQRSMASRKAKLLSIEEARANAPQVEVRRTCPNRSSRASVRFRRMWQPRQRGSIRHRQTSQSEPPHVGCYRFHWPISSHSLTGRRSFTPGNCAGVIRRF